MSKEDKNKNDNYPTPSDSEEFSNIESEEDDNNISTTEKSIKN